MVNLSPSNLKTVLCIGCHADDIEIGCGGAMLRLIRDVPNIAVHWVVLGAQGPRANEAQRSAQMFLEGATNPNVEIQSFRDSYFPLDYEPIKDYLHEFSSRVKPDLIFTHRQADAHQDHRVAGQLTWCAFRNQMILEYEIPKYEGDLGRPNVYFPLENAAADRKCDLLMEAFATQRSKGWFQREVFESLMRLRGIECKAPSGMAEAFHGSKLIV